MANAKTIQLLAISIITLAAFILLPQNSQWMGKRIVPYWYDFQYQKNHLGIEERKIARYKDSYPQSKKIAAYLSNKNNVLVLLPSEAYFKKYGLVYKVPEPAVFYYFTGLKTTWANSSMAPKATWIVGMRNNQLVIDSVSSPGQVEDSIASYQKFPYPL